MEATYPARGSLTAVARGESEGEVFGVSKAEENTTVFGRSLFPVYNKQQILG